MAFLPPLKSSAVLVAVFANTSECPGGSEPVLAATFLHSQHIQLVVFLLRNKSRRQCVSD